VTVSIAKIAFPKIYKVVNVGGFLVTREHFENEESPVKQGRFKRVLADKLPLQRGDLSEIRALGLRKGNLRQLPEKAWRVARAWREGLTILMLCVRCACGREYGKKATEWRNGHNIRECGKCQVKTAKAMNERLREFRRKRGFFQNQQKNSESQKNAHVSR
jgi:hypothetical protein